MESMMEEGQEATGRRATRGRGAARVRGAATTRRRPAKKTAAKRGRAAAGTARGRAAKTGAGARRTTAKRGASQATKRAGQRSTTAKKGARGAKRTTGERRAASPRTGRASATKTGAKRATRARIVLLQHQDHARDEGQGAEPHSVAAHERVTRSPSSRIALPASLRLALPASASLRLAQPCSGALASLQSGGAVLRGEVVKLSISPMDKVRAAGKFLDVKVNRRPLTVSLEVTKRCNARCDFCDYWKISDRDELADFTDVIRRFDPLVVVFTGGEPMIRRDLTPIVQSIKDMPGFRYLTLLTHGGFLSEKKIEELSQGGHQPNQHLDELPRRPAGQGARHPRPLREAGAHRPQDGRRRGTAASRSRRC